MNQHEKYMNRCLELARLGEGHVSPNPLVGAVVLDVDGNVVGEGYHQKYGEAHAEVNALNMAGDKAKDGILYVNLEPCCHWGKTPPCINRVIEAGISIVVIGMVDPNPKVAGQGIKIAKENGIEVIENVLISECLKLNEIFIKNIIKKQPFISIKTACTIDGKIATSSRASKWITSEAARAEVHKLRNKYDAILTGSGTILADNPSLNCRIDGGKSPIRVILDSKGLVQPEAKVFQDDGIRVIVWKNHDINALFEYLYKEGINSVLVEAGAGLNSALLKEKLVDKIYYFIAPKIMGDKNAIAVFEGFLPEKMENCTNFLFGEVKNFPPDIMMEGYFNND